MIHTWKLITLCYCLLIAGCGFQLRGAVDLPPELQLLYIESTPAQSDVAQALVTNFRNNNVHIVDSPQQAPVTLAILNEQITQTIDSVSASTTTRQYTLRYRLNYQLQQRNGQVIVGPCTTMVDRIVTINTNQVLGSSNEKMLIEQEMRQDAARSVLNTLSSEHVLQQLQYTQWNYA